MQIVEHGLPTPMMWTMEPTTGAVDPCLDTFTLWDWPAEIPHTVDTTVLVGLEIDIADVTT
jgi:hypothetical protein